MDDIQTITTIETLSEDILHIIFSHFDEQTILRGRCVNRYWWEILNSSHFKIWDAYRKLSSKTRISDIFLQACEEGSVLGVKYISRIFCDIIRNLDCSAHYLWNEGLIISAERGHQEIVKIICGFSVSYGGVEALRRAVKNGHDSTVKILLEEVEYSNPYEVTRIFKEHNYSLNE